MTIVHKTLFRSTFITISITITVLTISLFGPKAFSEDTTSSPETSSPSWQVAVDKGTESFNKGNLRLATFYYSNALGKAPGNRTIIETYRQTLLSALATVSESEIKMAYISALDTFLQNQITQVSVEDVPVLAQWLEELDVQRQQLLEDDPLGDETPVAQISQEQLINESFDELKQALADKTSAVIGTLGLVSEDSRMLEIASYQLQECEQILRSLIAIQPTLAREKKLTIAQLYDDVKKLSQTVLDEKSRIVLQAFLDSELEFSAELAQYDREQPDNPTSFSADDGIYKKQINVIQQRMAKLQMILPKLSDKYLGDMTNKTDSSRDPMTAAAQIQKLQKLLEYAAKKQQKAYNAWAISQIKQGLDEAYQYEGTFINGSVGRIGIGKALITFCGPIDQRYLTSEVSRCYQEFQNKYLADNQLNPPKKGENFDEPGSKLHTLKQIYETTKIQLSQF